MKKLTIILALSLCLLLFAACNPDKVSDASPTAAPTDTPAPTAVPTPHVHTAQVLLQQHLDELSLAFDAGINTLASGAYYTAFGGESPSFIGDGCYSNLVAPTQNSSVFGGLFSFGYITDGKVSILGSALGSRAVLEQIDDAQALAIGANHALVLHLSGKVSGFGNATFDKLKLDGWVNVSQIGAGLQHSVGLDEDGSVLATGDNSFLQCEVSSWDDIVQIAVGFNHTVALNRDGKVFATGDNSYSQCDVDGWENIKAIYCGANYTLALTEDFTLLATGDNRDGQCEVSQWEDVVEVACGVWHTAARTLDGTILYCGANSNGQLDPQGELQSVNAYVYGVESENGPWCYLSNTGGVIICYDTSHERIPIRADLFATEGNLPFSAFADCDDSAKGRQMPVRIARQNDVVFAMTADYVGHRGNRKGVMIRNGKVFYDKTVASTAAFFPDGTMRLFRKNTDVTAEQLLAEGVSNSFAFGPILVDNYIIDQETLDAPKHYPCPRCAIGMVEPYHFIAIVSSLDNPLKLDWLAQIFVDYGCPVAYNMDGGNSSSMVFMGEQVNLHRYNYIDDVGMRALSDVLAFQTDSSIPDEDDPYVRTIVINAPKD